MLAHDLLQFNDTHFCSTIEESQFSKLNSERWQVRSNLNDSHGHH